MQITKGIVGLIESRKGIAFLLTLAISSVALFSGKLPGNDFGIVMGIIFGVFSASHAYQESSKPGDPPVRGRL